MSLGDGLKAFNWVTDRLDQVSKFFKKKGRENEVDKINKSVDSGNDDVIADKLRAIKKSRDSRASQ